MDNNQTDYVNEFFRAHYPTDISNCEADWCGQGVEQRYRGGSSATIFPEMKLADGLSLSVQGHFGAYSNPRSDFANSYSEVEILGPKDIPELAEYQRECNAFGETEMIYPYVPVSIVNQMIASRGGLI